MRGPSRDARIGTVRLVALKLVLNTAVRLVYPFLPAIARGLDVVGATGADAETDGCVSCLPRDQR